MYVEAFCLLMISDKRLMEMILSTEKTKIGKRNVVLLKYSILKEIAIVDMIPMNMKVLNIKDFTFFFLSDEM